MNAIACEHCSTWLSQLTLGVLCKAGIVLVGAPIRIPFYFDGKDPQSSLRHAKNDPHATFAGLLRFIVTFMV